MRSFDLGRTHVPALVLALCATLAPIGLTADEPSGEESLAAYADAANFQTNGALDLAIEAWNQYLDEYGDDPMASKAAHYLGVCHMQHDEPDYVAAANAFRKALQDSDYELREESLVNHGWCLYAAAGDGPDRDAKSLKESLRTFSTLRQEFPESKFVDRAIFYSAEAAYGLGETRQAVKFYDELLALPDAKDSPLRCDALYARGVAYEDLNQVDKAVASFRQLLGGCDRKDLITDVHLRMGDAAILRKEYDKAIEAFESAVRSTDAKEDQAYALFRQAFALVQAKRPAEAAAKYEQLLAEHPESPYAATARLAAAQSAYRGGEMKIAETRFREVLAQGNTAAATEAAHWLARMRLAENKPTEAAKIAKQRIDEGAEGDYEVSLRLDLAEALSVNQETVGQSAALFHAVYRDHPDHPLAPRALYNAAFSALQSGQPESALQWANQFAKTFPADTLRPDVAYIAAEAYLGIGNPKRASEIYRSLLRQAAIKSNVQRPLWVLRAAAASNAAKRFDETVALLRDEMGSLNQTTQLAEAQMLLGFALLSSGEPDEAAAAFEDSAKADPKWPRADEARVLSGQALLAAGKGKAAGDVWARLVKRVPETRMADQARYKLAQMYNADGDYARAVVFYDQIISGRHDPPLLPYAKYGRGWSLLQAEKYEAALRSLDDLINEHEKHPVTRDALLARGIAKRNQRKWKDAESDLQSYLESGPRGTNLGHALYELALIDQHQSRPERAAKRLQRLVEEVPNYPDMDKVLYELGWSLRETGDEDAAEERFAELTSKFPETALSAEAAFFVGQKNYAEEKWDAAAKQYELASKMASDDELSEKALYRLGWSYFKDARYEESGKAFGEQASRHADGKLAIDAMMMIGECRFKQAEYEAALGAYDSARRRIRERNETAKTIRDQAERQVRELILLHGGQSAAQLRRWKEAIEWYDELAQRFPATVYLPQAFYEKGFAYQQLGDPNRAIKFYAQVANNYRNEVAARARFMMGEIYFGNRQFVQAIPEFQRVMFGYGAEKAPDAIKNWQAKSGFEAGRCSELLLQQATTEAAKAKSKKFAEGFFQYVISKHPDHELAEKSRKRLEALSRF